MFTSSTWPVSVCSICTVFQWGAEVKFCVQIFAPSDKNWSLLFHSVFTDSLGSDVLMQTRVKSLIVAEQLPSKTGCKWNQQFPIAVISWVTQLMGCYGVRAETRPQLLRQHRHASHAEAEQHVHMNYSAINSSLTFLLLLFMSKTKWFVLSKITLLNVRARPAADPTFQKLENEWHCTVFYIPIPARNRAGIRNCTVLIEGWFFLS